MLRRLIAWCVPSSALRVRIPEPSLTDVEQALAPYEGEVDGGGYGAETGQPHHA